MTPSGNCFSLPMNSSGRASASHASSQRRRKQRALTRLELLAVLGALALLAGVALPVLARGKPRSDVALCANNLRQLGVAALMHSMEEGGVFPARGTTNLWPQQLLRFYSRLDVLHCPADVPNPRTFVGPAAFPADRAARSYLINGWNDYYLETFGIFPPTSFNGSAMLESAIPSPSQTILFGEKLSDSGHFYMDLIQAPGNDFFEVEHARHGARRAGAVGGGSNHSMADGSVRTLNYGQALAPTNLWAVMDRWRTNTLAIP